MKIKTKDRKRFRIRNRLKRNNPNNRMRLTVSRSSKNISAQIIDDMKQITLVSSSSIEKGIKLDTKIKKVEISKIIAEKLAKKAQEKKISKIYFDRGIYKYHGRIKVFADVLRKNGLIF